VEILHKEFLRVLDETTDINLDKLNEIEIENIMSKLTSNIANMLKDSLMKSEKEMLKERRKLSNQFMKDNIKRWDKAFDKLETLIVICTEAGEEFNKIHRSAVTETNLLYDIIIRHHARACHISQEILCLLKSGYADAAHARWRVLHEVNTTAMFIKKHGDNCAERFYFHDIIESYDGMLEYKVYEDRLHEQTFTQKEINNCKKEYDSLIEKYGKKYADHYGWASYLFPNHRRVGFVSIEKDVGLDHMRPYYKWASRNIHSTAKGMRNRLGLCETKEDILLVGQSNSGMTDPAHATAISLCQITTTLLTLEPTLDNIVILKIIYEYEKEVAKYFVNVELDKSL